MEWAYAVGSSLLSGGIVAALAKAFIAKSFRDLEQVAEKVGEIKSELSAIAVKLGTVEKDRERLYEHDRKLAALENQVYVARKAAAHRQ
jgi:hypothetical protein